MEILTLQFWLSVASIIVLDLVLAGDNAVVIAMAARQLPARLQNKAIFIGAAGAILVRASLTLVAVKLLTIPLLHRRVDFNSDRDQTFATAGKFVDRREKSRLARLGRAYDYHCRRGHEFG